MQTSRGRWQRDSDGVWLCFLVRESDAVMALESMEPGKSYDLTVKRHTERRSLDANAYMWVLLDRLADDHRNPQGGHIPALHKGHRRELRNGLRDQ